MVLVRPQLQVRMLMVVFFNLTCVCTYEIPLRLKLCVKVGCSVEYIKTYWAKICVAFPYTVMAFVLLMQFY